MAISRLSRISLKYDSASVNHRTNHGIATLVMTTFYSNTHMAVHFLTSVKRSFSNDVHPSPLLFCWTTNDGDLVKRVDAGAKFNATWDEVRRIQSEFLAQLRAIPAAVLKRWSYKELEAI